MTNTTTISIRKETKDILWKLARKGRPMTRSSENYSKRHPSRDYTPVGIASSRKRSSSYWMNHEPLGRRAVLDTSKEIVSLNVTARMPLPPVSLPEPSPQIMGTGGRGSPQRRRTLTNGTQLRFLA